MPARVLLTRHEPAAVRTAAKLRAAGHEPIVLPCSRLEDTGTPVPPGRWAALILTSTAALDVLRTRAQWAQIRERLEQLPVWVVGRLTAKAALDAGLREPDLVAYDAAGLAEQVVGRAAGDGPGSRPILYLAASDRSFDFDEVFRPQGISLETVEVYRNRLVVPPAEEIRRAVGAADTAFLYSRRTASHLIELLQRYTRADDVSALHFVAISPAVADVVASMPNVSIAAGKDEEEMINAIETDEPR